MSSVAIRMQFETLREIAYSSLTTSYISIGGPLLNPARQFILQNLTDQNVYFSLDGVNPIIKLPSGGYLISDVASNKTNIVGLFMVEGDIMYVKYDVTAPSAGSVCFSVMYGSEN